MHSSICVQRDGKTYRLAWVSESKGGVYFGHLGAKEDHHISYHQDGTRHFKSGDVYHGESVAVPIASQTGFLQLSNSYVPLTKEWLKPSTEYPRSTRPEILITIAEADVVSFNCVSIDWFLVDRASEEQLALADAIQRMAKDSEHRQLRGFHVLALDHYSDHKLVIVMWAAQNPALPSPTPTAGE